MVPLVPKVAALYTVKGVVVPDPLPKVLLPAKNMTLRRPYTTRTWVLWRASSSRGQHAQSPTCDPPVAVMPPVLVRRPATVAAACKVAAALTTRALLLLVPRTVLP